MPFKTAVSNADSFVIGLGVVAEVVSSSLPKVFARVDRFWPQPDYMRAPKACAKWPNNGTMITLIVKLDRIRAT